MNYNSQPLTADTYQSVSQDVDVSGNEVRTIGIDVAHILRDLSYQPLVEVLPSDFVNEVTQMVDYMINDLRKKVVLMFDGLLEDVSPPIVKNFTERNQDDTTPVRLETMLRQQNAGGPRNVTTSDTMNALYIELTRCYNGNANVLVMRAPYFAWSQLAALYEQQQINEVYGPIEMLMFPNIKRVLMRWYGDKTFMSLDSNSLCQLSGRSATETIASSSNHRYIGGDGYTLRNQPGRFVALYSPVYSMRGQQIDMVRLDNVIGNIPSQLNRGQAMELNVFFGKNIWNANRGLMLQMSYGVLPVAVVRAIVYESGQGLPLTINTTFSSDNINGGNYFPAFQTCLNYMHPLLVQIVYQVIDKCRPNANASGRPPQITLDEWELTGWQTQHLPHWLSYLELLGLRARPQAMYPDSVAVHLAVRLKVLDLMGYFTHAMTSEAPDDSGLSSFALALRNCKSAHACAGVLFIEACRTMMLHGRSLLGTTNGQSAPTDAIPAELEAYMLGARIMSLMKLRRTKADLKVQPWNMNIIAFSNLVRLSFSVLQQLNLVMASNTFAGANFNDISNTAIYDNLIFNEAPTPHMGFVVYKIFTSKTALTAADLQKSFPEATNLVEDLRDAVEFFHSVSKMVEDMREDDTNMDENQTEEIRNAYRVCCDKLRMIKELCNPDGTLA